MPCTCEHEVRRIPETEDEALALATHARTIEGQLEVIARANDKWMSVLRCKRCGALWAEDSLASGHATMLYMYPIATDDPLAWLAAARPLDPPRR